MERLKNYIRLMRPKHCIKNVLIWLPLIFNGSLFNFNKLIAVIFGFFSFSFLASAVYIINDIKDAPKDRLHPTKKNRPIASGAVKIREGGCLICTCLTLSLLFNYFTSSVVLSLVCLIAYLFINISYSCGLKNVPILDIVILTAGFVIRLIYGGIITDILISGWLYLTIITASFYLGLGKRRNELRRTNIINKETRGVLKFYNYAFLDKNMYMCLGMAEVFYALWAIDRKQDLMLWTVPVIIVIGMKYSLGIEGESEGDPVEVILHDKTLWIISIIYAVIVLYAVYMS